MELFKQAHAVYYARYHIVFCTKYRRKLLKNGLDDYLKKSVLGIMRHYPDLIIHEVNTDIDHVHMLITIPPKVSVSKAINIIKINTSKQMKQKFNFINNMYHKDNVPLWSTGYFVSTIGINESVIRQYIEHQGAEDGGRVRLVFGE